MSVIFIIAATNYLKYTEFGFFAFTTGHHYLLCCSIYGRTSFQRCRFNRRAMQLSTFCPVFIILFQYHILFIRCNFYDIDSKDNSGYNKSLLKFLSYLFFEIIKVKDQLKVNNEEHTSIKCNV